MSYKIKIKRKKRKKRHNAQKATSNIFIVSTFDLCSERQAFSCGPAVDQLRASCGSAPDEPT